MKILLKIFSILLIASTAFAEGPDRFFEFSDFSGMLQSHISPYLIPKNAATQALNVRVNQEYGSVTKRPKMLLLNACREFPVKSLHRYYKSDDTKYLLETSSSFMDLVNEEGGACTELKSGLSDGKRWSWVTYKDLAIGTNGTNNPVKYDGKSLATDNIDGARTAGDLVTDLGAPFAELNTGANLTASTWYQYRVAFYDGEVYKFSTARSNPILTGAVVRDITLTDIPLGPAGTTQRIIYRTTGQASRAAVVADNTFFQVATISNNIDRTYDDAVTDATIAGDTVPTWATVSAGIDVTPPHGKYALIHKERLFLANDPSGIESGKSTIYNSYPFNPDYFVTATDYDLIRPDDGDEITFIKNLSGILTIGKTNTIQKLYTDSPSSTGWTVSDPFSYVGCDAPYSVVNSLVGLIYKNRFGLYRFNGQSSELISDVVTDRLRDILETNDEDVVAAYHDNQYLMAYTSKSTGAGVNDRVLLLDTVRNAYVEDSKNIDSFVIFDSGNDFGTLYSGSSLDGKLFSHSGSFNTYIVRYKSELEAGTGDTVTYLGDQTNPSVELGWGTTNDSALYAGLTQDDVSALYPEAINDRPRKFGYWYSPVTFIGANHLDKLYWNEQLGSTGNVTFAVRTGVDSAAVSAAAWSSDFSDPSGSNISALTANQYFQLRASLTTTDITTTPRLFLEDSFLTKLTYTKEGSDAETSIASVWSSGLTDFEAGNSPKRIKEIQVFYAGTSGMLNVAYSNDQGNVSQNFDIDLSVNPDSSTSDAYYGSPAEKVYVYIPSVVDSPTGRRWRFTLTESGVTEWTVRRIPIRFDTNEYVTYR